MIISPIEVAKNTVLMKAGGSIYSENSDISYLRLF